MTGTIKSVAASLVLAATAVCLTGCGDDDDGFNEPDVGEQQRQTCVDSGKVALIQDGMVIACVTVEQYSEMRDVSEGAP